MKNATDPRNDLARQLLRSKMRQIVLILRDPHRDVAGQLLANGVTSVRLVAFLAGARFGQCTEIERRAVVNSRNRLQANIRS